MTPPPPIAHLFLLLFVLCLAVHIYCTTADESPQLPPASDDPTTLCYARNRTQRAQIAGRLATKTPYRYVANTDTTPPIAEAIAGCRPTRVWSMIRHGTRSPNRKILQALEGRLLDVRDAILLAQQTPTTDGGQRTLCDNDRELFEGWTPLKRPDDEMGLDDEGEVELRELAERMQLRFADVMPDIWRNESYRFKFTDSQRTRKSYEAFATGLFGLNNICNIWLPQPSRRDPVLRFYKLCDRWSKEVDSNPAAIAEAEAFRRSAHVSDAVRIVTQRAGLPPGHLTTSEVHLIYTLCAFETAWLEWLPSAWCSLFDEHTASVFEYLEDLEYYHIDGYGNELTYRQACPALNDMFDRLTAPAGDVPPAATFYFSHSGTLLKMLAMLGLYRDAEPLDRHGFEAQRERSWRVSRIDAFGSNLAFVMYNCSAADGAFSSHILFQHQERTVRLPGCPTDADLCPLAQFRSVYRHALGEACRFDEMCSLRDVPDDAAAHANHYDDVHHSEL